MVSNLVDIRCCNCNKLLGRINGDYQIKCTRCNKVNENTKKESVEDGKQ
jgi:phage FluMu protein Com